MSLCSSSDLKESIRDLIDSLLLCQEMTKAYKIMTNGMNIPRFKYVSLCVN